MATKGVDRRKRLKAPIHIHAEVSVVRALAARWALLPGFGFLAAGGGQLGALALQFWRADFVGGGVAGEFERAPHVPGSDRAVGAPAFAEGEKFLGTRHVFFAISDGPALFDA